MDVDKIKLVVNNPILSKDQQEQLIINILSEDKDILPTLLSILHVERQQQKEIIVDLNAEVSRYHIHINDPKLLKKNREFLNEQTGMIYKKWKAFIRPCFNNKF